jgi:hypothetical protein
MSAPNEIEEKLLDVSKRFDAALTDLKQDELKALLADEAVLHHGGRQLNTKRHMCQRLICSAAHYPVECPQVGLLH